MGWIEPEPFGLFCPDFADELIGCQALEGLEPAREIVGRDEVGEVSAQLIVIVVVEALDGRFLDGSVHPLDLAVRPGMLDLCEPVFDAMFVADAVEDMLEGVLVARPVGELDAVVGQNGMDGIGHGRDQVAKELGHHQLARRLVQFRIGELGRPVDSNEEAQLALGGLHLGDVDMEMK